MKKIVVVSRSLLPSSKSSCFLEPEYGYASESRDVCCWRTATKERERRRTRRNITFQVQQNILLYFSVRFFFVDFFLSEEERKFPTKKSSPAPIRWWRQEKNTTLKFYLLWLNDRSRKYQEIYQITKLKHIYLIWNEIYPANAANTNT